MNIKNKRKHLKWLFVISILITIIVAIGIALWFSSQSSAPRHNKRIKTETSQSKREIKAESDNIFNKTAYSTTDPHSIWVVVNKQHPLNPHTYVPNNLVSIQGMQVSAEILPSLQALITQAKAEGVMLRVISGYRSYSYQTNLYNSYVAQDGRAQADTYSARPGFSEHQTGLAVDLGGIHGCDVEQCFGETIEGKWLAEHASDYGFLIRYTPDKEDITGYSAEPWHLRYVGKELTAEMKRKGVKTLEEFFGVSGGKQYSD